MGPNGWQRVKTGPSIVQKGLFDPPQGGPLRGALLNFSVFDRFWAHLAWLAVGGWRLSLAVVGWGTGVSPLQAMRSAHDPPDPGVTGLVLGESGPF